MTPAALIARASALLVDVDGTLVDSTAPVRRTWRAFASRHGLDPEQVFRFAQGRPSRLRAADLPIPRVLVSDGLERGRPDPACFLIAARRLGADPQRCVVLEDAPAGIRAGRAARATVIALRTTYSDDELREAHVIADNLFSLTTTPDRPTNTKPQRTRT